MHPAITQPPSFHVLALYQKKHKLNPNTSPSAGQIGSNWFIGVTVVERQHIIKVITVSVMAGENNLRGDLF